MNEEKSRKIRLNFKEFYINYESEVYKIIIIKDRESIIIKSNNYKVKLKSNESTKKYNLFKEFSDSNKLFDLIINSFNNDQALIKNIIYNKIMILILKIKNFENNKERNIEINLLYSKPTNEYPILKSNEIIINNSFSNLPQNFGFNPFIVFNSVYEILYLIFTKIDRSIMCYDLNEDQLIAEIKNAHKNTITSFSHCYLKNKYKDIIMSVSTIDNNFKLWDINNYSCILNFDSIKNKFYYFFIDFIYDYNNYYIITANNFSLNKTFIIYDFEGNIKDTIKDSEEEIIISLDLFYENDKTYIIVCQPLFIKSYIYQTKKLYHIYKDKNISENQNIFAGCFLYKNDNILQLFELSTKTDVRIWNFHEGILIKKYIWENNIFINDACLWGNRYIVTARENCISIFDLNEGKEVENIKNQYSLYINKIKKIKHQLYGDCLICQEIGTETNSSIFNNSIFIYKE